MTEPTDAELIAELEAAGVSFLAFLGGLSGAKKVWTTSGSQDAKKIAAGMRAAIAKWGTPPAPALVPCGFCELAGIPACKPDSEHEAERECGQNNPAITTQAQAGAVPLADEQIDAAAKKLAECMEYPWEFMPEPGRENMRKHAQAVIAAANGSPPPPPSA